MSDPGESSRFRAGLIVAGLLCAVMFAPMALGRPCIYDDTLTFFLPVRAFLASCLESGDDPSWCPNLFGGFFLGGEGAGIAHPMVRHLYGTLPLDQAYNLEIFGCYPALFAGFVVLLGRWGIRRDAAAFGGLIFAFGGYNLLHHIHVNVMWTLAHLPWLLLTIDVALRSTDARRVYAARVALGLLTASEVMLAHAQFVWIVGLGEALYVLVLAWQVPGIGRRLPGLAASKAVGVLGGSAQLLPLWDAFRDSERSRPSRTFVAMGSLPPLNLLQWVAPYLTASRVVTPPMAIDGGTLPPAPCMFDWRVHEFAVYLGAAIPALLTWLALRRKELGRLRPLAALGLVLAAVALVLAFGGYTPLFGLMRKIPVVGRFRIQARYLSLFQLGMAILAAVAFASLTSVRDRTPWRRLWPLALPVVASVLACFAPRLPEGLWPSYLRAPYIATTAAVVVGPLLVAGASALVALSARGSRWAPTALIVFAAADLMGYGLHVVWYNPPRTIAEHRAARPGPPGGGLGKRVKFDELNFTLHDLYALNGLRSVQGYAALVPRRLLSYKTPASLRVAGVEWVLPAHDERPESWRPVAGALPRARLVARARPSIEPRRDLEAIDVEAEALVAGGLPVPLPTGPPGRARLIGDRPGKITVTTDAAARRLLVVSESYHRGWRATVDGHSTPVFRVNGDFLGCVVPGGSHRVKLRFRPWSQEAGAWLSALGVVLAVAVPSLGLVRGPLRAGAVAGAAGVPLRGPRSGRSTHSDARA